MSETGRGEPGAQPGEAIAERPADRSGEAPAKPQRRVPVHRAKRRRRPAGKVSVARIVEHISAATEGRPARARIPNSIVPPRTVARRTLLALVAIMSFLACLSVAAVSVVAERADAWQRQIADEVTIQIKPGPGVDMARSVARAAEIAGQAYGVNSAVPIPREQSEALLQPWLGSDFQAEELPIPRLVAVRVSGDADLRGLAARLKQDVPGASLDDHGQWLKRLSAMANVMTLLGSLVLGLVFAATALCVVFATRGAMAGNRIVIEVLHLVGAEDSYIAREFQRHFLMLGLQGAGIGGGIAAVLFLGAGLFGGIDGPTPEEAQLRSLIGGLEVGATGYLGSAMTVLALAVIIAITARLTVRHTLTQLD